MDTPLPPAEDLAALRKPRFAGESAEYAASRQTLLAHEIEARRQLARLAAELRQLPPGPVIGGNYRFIDANGAEVGLADMFGGRDTLVLYHWMYGPDRGRPCPMCTNLIGPLAANAADLRQRVGLAIVAHSPVERQIAFAIERGWRDVPLYQSIGDEFSLAIGGLDPEKGWEMPVLMVLVKQGDAIRLHWMGETTQDMADPGEDPRGATEIAPLWTVLDLTPGGRGGDWYPKLSYLP